MSNGRTYKKNLPNLAGKTLIGSSAGNLIMEDKKCQFWILNSFTGHEFHFPSLPLRNDRNLIYDRVILTKFNSSPDIVCVALTLLPHSLQFCRHGSDKWEVYSYAYKPWIIRDIAVFQGAIIVVTDRVQIGVFVSVSPLELELLEVTGTPILSPSMQLVTTNHLLLIADFHPLSQLKLYFLNFRMKKWGRVMGLDDHALFLGYNKWSAIINPKAWGGRSNCIYRVGSLDNKLYVYSFDGQILEKILLVGNPRVCSMMSLCWYYLDQCYKLKN